MMECDSYAESEFPSLQNLVNRFAPNYHNFGDFGIDLQDITASASIMGATASAAMAEMMNCDHSNERTMEAYQDYDYDDQSHIFVHNDYESYYVNDSEVITTSPSAECDGGKKRKIPISTNPPSNNCPLSLFLPQSCMLPTPPLTLSLPSCSGLSLFNPQDLMCHSYYNSDETATENENLPSTPPVTPLISSQSSCDDMKVSKRTCARPRKVSFADERLLDLVTVLYYDPDPDVDDEESSGSNKRLLCKEKTEKDDLSSQAEAASSSSSYPVDCTRAATVTGSAVTLPPSCTSSSSLSSSERKQRYNKYKTSGDVLHYASSSPVTTESVGDSWEAGGGRKRSVSTTSTGSTSSSYLGEEQFHEQALRLQHELAMPGDCGVTCSIS